MSNITALDFDTITEILKGESPAVAHKGPLGVLIQSDYCVMCARQNGPKVKVMYSVNGDPLCSPHAMYVLSKICMDNGYEVTISEDVSDKSSSDRNSS